MASESTLDTAGGPANGRSPETVDRMMVGICGAIWLVALAAGVFAVVALIRLGSGQTGGGEQQSSWLLYSIIVVSALVILGAIPLLLRARRNAQADSVGADTATADAEPVRPIDAPTEKMRVFGVDPYDRAAAVEPQPAVSPALAAVVDRLWLRGTTSLLSAMGLAYIAVAVGTYLLAVGSDTASWVAFGVAGVITVAMVAILAHFQRHLGEAVDDAA